MSESKLNIYQKLSKIQCELKAPKSNYNSFGKYHYRSCEDILEGIKPLLKKYECCLIITDDVQLVGDRYYIVAKAKLVSDDGSFIDNTALARESLDKKGMDSSQVTGATSSYARKYALNGLLAIDDTKDADTMDNSVKYATKEQLNTINLLNIDKVMMLKHYNISTIEQLTYNQAQEIINKKSKG